MPNSSITPSEAVWPAGCQHAAVLRAVEEEWRFCGPARVEELAQWAKRDPRMAPFIARADPNQFVLVREYSSCEYCEDTRSDEFAGDAMRSWIRDEAGLRVVGVEDLERLDARPHTQVTFYCYPNGTDVLWSIVVRPRVGRGGQCTVDPRDPELGGVTWIC